ncbi:hypothetical protein BD01_0587 [Thermococcus nautili]|uniref:Uncharacterized protein n=1 Tax=Thermococcus nautili TaxID=195522 RepID=W8P0I7_9EURY|nr:hypothetical protein BD01_0587 [Thermococcus nautili]
MRRLLVNVARAIAIGAIFYYLVGSSRGIALLPLYAGTILAVGYILINIGALVGRKLHLKKALLDVALLYAFAIPAALLAKRSQPAVGVAVVSTLAFVLIHAMDALKKERAGEPGV